MNYKLLGGAVVAIALAVSSGAWGNPKNSFSDGNYTQVDSYAWANAGDYNVNYFSDVDRDGDNTASATSESYNLSVEGVNYSTLEAYSAYNWIYQENYDGDNSIEWAEATATASGNGLAQAAANSGVGSVNAQIQSVSAAGNISF
jgi:hypothetical protein